MANISSYQKLKLEIQQLKLKIQELNQDIFFLVEKGNDFEGVMTKGKYKFKYDVHEVMFRGSLDESDAPGLTGLYNVLANKQS